MLSHSDPQPTDLPGHRPHASSDFPLIEDTPARKRVGVAVSLDQMVRRVAKDYPYMKVIGTTLREVLMASENNWSAILYWAETDTFYQGPSFDRLIIEDRVGDGARIVR